MKSKLLKVLCVVFALFVFAIMAMGSGSDGESENKGDNGANTGENSTVQEKNVDYKVGDAQIGVYTNSINSTYVKIAVPVTNTGNCNLFLSAGSVDIEGSDGTIEDTLSLVSCYPQIIKPGETAWYFENTLYDGSSKDGLKAILHEDVEEAKVDCIRYEVSEIALKDDQYLGVNVTGRVENTTDEDATLPYVAALLFDKDNALIGVDFTILDDLKAKAKVGFKTSGLDLEISASDVAKYEVYAYPNQFQF